MRKGNEMKKIRIKVTYENLTEKVKEDFNKFCETINIVNTSGTEYGLISKIFEKGPKDKNGNHKCLFYFSKMLQLL